MRHKFINTCWDWDISPIPMWNYLPKDIISEFTFVVQCEQSNWWQIIKCSHFKGQYGLSIWSCSLRENNEWIGSLKQIDFTNLNIILLFILIEFLNSLGYFSYHRIPLIFALPLNINSIEEVSYLPYNDSIFNGGFWNYRNRHKSDPYKPDIKPIDMVRYDDRGLYLIILVVLLLDYIHGLPDSKVSVFPLEHRYYIFSSLAKILRKWNQHNKAYQ